MKRSLLTVQSIKFLPVKDKTYEVPDIPGLFLRIHPSGKKVWKMNKSINKKRITKTLGEYPKDLSIAQAREKIKEYSGESKRNKNISTFGSIFEEWLELKKQSIKEWESINSRIRRVLMPELHDMLWEDITPMLVVKTIKQNYTKGQDPRALIFNLHNLETYALNMGYTTSRKFDGILQVFPRRETQHRPTLEPAELPIFFANLQNLAANRYWGYDHIPYVLLCFYTLLRNGEVVRLQWSFVNQEKKLITIPASVMKMRKEHSVPITTQIEELLSKLPHDRKYILPYDVDGTSLRHIQVMLQRIFAQITVNNKKLVPHGIRAMGRTWMAENDVDFEVAENCLAHKVGNAVVQAYNRTTLLEKRRIAMQRWNKYVETCFNESKTAEQACNEVKNEIQ